VTLLQLRKELYMFTLPLFLLLQVAAGFVLLLACANLANLAFARMYSFAAGVVAMAASFASVRALRTSIPAGWTKWVPGWDGIRVDGNVVALTILAALGVGFFLGLAVVLHTGREDPNKTLKETGTGTVTRTKRRVRNALVVAQVMFALILLVYETTLFSIKGQAAVKASEVHSADLQIASPAYFETLKISTVAGRMFSDADSTGVARVVVISREMASRFWPKGDALGHRIRFGALDSTEPWLTVVGVVGDVRQNWWNPITRPLVYQPFAQAPQRSMTLLMRTTPNPASYVSAMRDVVRQVDPQVPLRGVNTLEEEIADAIAIVRIMGILMGIFGLVALALSSIGVYGVLSESVAQRTHEIGIRLALGANAHDLMKMILAEALKLTGIGLLIAVPCAVAISRAMESLIFGVVRVDLAILSGFAALLVAASLGAAYIPARRAMRVDPMISLRYE